jgi:PAS domain S-box-containing protein
VTVLGDDKNAFRPQVHARHTEGAITVLRLDPLPARYGLALGASAVVTLLCLFYGAGVVGSDVSYFGFALVILLSALMGGPGPGLLATAVSALASAFLLLPPMYSIRVASGEERTRLILFALEGILLSWIGKLVRDSSTADVHVSRTMRYVPAVLLVAAAVGFKLVVFRNVERELPFAFFYAAIAASGWLGGLGPGFVAAVLCSLAARFFFLYPQYSLAVVSETDLTRLSVFVVEGLFLSVLSAKHETARRLASDALEDLRYYSRRLKMSLDDLRALRATSRDLIWEWDVAGDRMVRGMIDPEYAETPAHTMNLSSWLEQIHPDDRMAVRASLGAALREGSEEWRCEYRVQRPLGRNACISEHAQIIRDAAGSPIRVVGRSAEIIDSNRATDAEYPQYPALYGRRPLAFLWVDHGLRIVSANRAARDLLEYSDTELIGRAVEKLFQPDRQQAITEILLGVMSPGRSSTTLYEECIRASGEIAYAKIHAAAIRVQDPPTLLLMIEWISERN